VSYLSEMTCGVTMRDELTTRTRGAHILLYAPSANLLDKMAEGALVILLRFDSTPP